MADEERSPLLGRSPHDATGEQPICGNGVARNTKTGERENVQLHLATFIPKLASVVLDFTITGLAQSAIGVGLFYVCCHMLTPVGDDP